MSYGNFAEKREFFPIGQSGEARSVEGLLSTGPTPSSLLEHTTTYNRVHYMV